MKTTKKYEKTKTDSEKTNRKTSRKHVIRKGLTGAAMASMILSGISLASVPAFADETVVSAESRLVSSQEETPAFLEEGTMMMPGRNDDSGMFPGGNDNESEFSGRSGDTEMFPDDRGGMGPFSGDNGESGEFPDRSGGSEMFPDADNRMGQFPGMDGDSKQFSGNNGESGQFPGMGGRMDGSMGGAMNGMEQNAASASSPSEIVESSTVNTASSLEADETSTETIIMSSENSQVKIEEAGTYIISGTCSDGNITVKKGTTGVVLILKDLDLTSSTGAAVSCNKGSEVKIIIEGSVKLTDAEDPADEDSSDAETADAFDGAALKIKDGANVYLTGSGTLAIDASACKNGIKVGDEDTPSFVIDGDLTISITAANDGINSGYDLTILNGKLNITASDDAIHADRILTIGSSDGSGPEINVLSSKEALEGTVVNLFGGKGTVKASDDAVNAANSDGTYKDTLTYSINITGGTWDITCTGGDGLDSNGNVNITGGSTTISSAYNGGEAGIDYDGSLYVEEGTLTNLSGISGPD
ncbi:MAG: carbohydrate-binding domain-containing protein, partial [Lachnospiraceae bacterium]|nr:carbohydrate-binding domain-containing protein [Lachnospiraceae bacterium]